MSDLPVTAADVGVLLVLLLSAVLAFARGFVHEALAIGSWGGAIVAVVFGLPYLRPFARDFFAPPLLADVVAGSVIFVIALIILSLITRSVARRVQESALNAVDRSLGAVFGLARGALLVCLAYIPVAWLMPPPEQPLWLRDARAMPLIERGSGWLRSLVAGADPQPAANAAQPLRRDLKQSLETEKMARDIMSPEPKSPSAPSKSLDQGYADKERRELERLLDTQR